MRVLAAILCLSTTAVHAQEAEFRYLQTFGSKDGIHPRTVLNRRPATAALGRPDNPYGLVYPVGVAVDARGRVWIPDSGTASVHVFDPADGGYQEIRRAGDIPLRRPSGIAVDRQGRMFVADSEARAVFMFDEKGEYDHALGRREGSLQGPTAVALSDDEKTIYVADPPRGVVAALNREGEVDGTIPIPAELGEPIGLAVVDNQVCVLGNRQRPVGVFSPAGKPRGELKWEGVPIPSAFAFDATRRRFLVANPRWTTIEIFTEAGRGLGAFGQRGDAVDQMRRVDALHVDSRGWMYVVDSRNGKVLVFADSPRALE